MDNRCGSMRIRTSLTRPTIRGRKAKGNRKTVEPTTLVLKGETDRMKAKALRAFPVSFGRAKIVVGRKSKKGTRNGCEHFRRFLERGQKRSREDARKEYEDATFPRVSR